MGKKYKDLKGQIFGAWLVVGPADRPAHVGGTAKYWSAQCRCGAIEIKRGVTLQHRMVGLGCSNCRFHGHADGKKGSQSQTYCSWKSMMTRCNNPRAKAYKNYGARGILVCERWRDFKNFLADMGERPPGTSIDRINNSRGYEPGNCRWADRKTQAHNSSCLRLTDKQVRKVRAMIARGAVRKHVAEKFKVSISLIHMIARGEARADA